MLVCYHNRHYNATRAMGTIAIIFNCLINRWEIIRSSSILNGQGVGFYTKLYCFLTIIFTCKATSLLFLIKQSTSTSNIFLATFTVSDRNTIDQSLYRLNDEHQSQNISGFVLISQLIIPRKWHTHNIINGGYRYIIQLLQGIQPQLAQVLSSGC